MKLAANTNDLHNNGTTEASMIMKAINAILFSKR